MCLIVILISCHHQWRRSPRIEQIGGPTLPDREPSMPKKLFQNNQKQITTKAPALSVAHKEINCTFLGINFALFFFGSIRACCKSFEVLLSASDGDKYVLVSLSVSEVGANRSFVTPHQKGKWIYVLCDWRVDWRWTMEITDDKCNYESADSGDSGSMSQDHWNFVSHSLTACVHGLRRAFYALPVKYSTIGQSRTFSASSCAVIFTGSSPNMC